MHTKLRRLKYIFFLPGTECSNYTMLTDPTRKSTAGITVKGCDKTIVKKWYRFSGTAGDMMQSTCVPTYRCNTDAPGWLKDPHPTLEQGILSKKVCFHWKSNCCHWNKYIRVRNCGSFYVYELIPAPVCHLRYCGAGWNRCTRDTGMFSHIKKTLKKHCRSGWPAPRLLDLPKREYG